MKDKQVQIPETLLWDLIRYHLGHNRDPERIQRITDGLMAKWGAVARRHAYSQSLDNKTAP